jgi:hypothetical protein
VGGRRFGPSFSFQPGLAGGGKAHTNGSPLFCELTKVLLTKTHDMPSSPPKTVESTHKLTPYKKRLRSHSILLYLPPFPPPFFLHRARQASPPMGRPHRAAAAAAAGRQTTPSAGSRALWLHMKLLLAVLLLLLGQVAGLVRAQGDGEGPGGRPCTLALAAKASTTSVKPGKTLKLTIRLTNRASTGFADGVFQLQLPPRASFKGGSAKLKAGFGGPRKPTYDPDTRTVTWSRLAIPARAKITFVVRSKIAKCYPLDTQQLPFTATAFVLDPNANEPTPLCVQENTIVVVRGWMGTV